MVKEIIIGTDLIEDIKKYDVILIGTSIKNALGNGFQHKIGVNFRDVLVKNKETNYDDTKKLGTCNVITTYVKQGFPVFVLCYITKGRYRPDKQPDAVDYDALRSCLELVNMHFKGKKVASTLIGNEKYEGGGDAKKIYTIIADTCDDIDLYIYDYHQENFLDENQKQYLDISLSRKDNKISHEEYEERMKKFLWEREFGTYIAPMPDMSLYDIKKEIKRIKEEWRNPKTE